MKGDFTRFTFNQDKHFTRVLKQQGRVDLDSDWNEQANLQEYQTETRAADVIGPRGVPRQPFPNTPPGRSSFEVYYENGKLRIAPGHLYLDGLLCELNAAVDYTAQPSFTPASPAPADQKRDFFYIDVWQRHVTAVEDPSIREVALGGPDTDTRLQTIWQVKARRLANNQAFDCQTGWQALVPQASTGKLTAWVEADTQPGEECELTPSGGYRGLENRLYRVEIHAGSNSGTPSFKWSRDNGAVLYPAATVAESGGGAAPKRVRLLQAGKDSILSLKRGDWVEVTSDTRDLLGQSGSLAQIDDMDQAGAELVLSADVSAYFNEQNLKVRRWDQPGPAISVGPGPFLLEDGIRVSFSTGTFASGDYWTFPARAATRDNNTGEIEPLTAAPAQGILHHYAPLALVTWHVVANTPATAQVSDCRSKFPWLTDLRASDVSFDNTNCALPGVDTVQEALDALCQAREGACSFVIKPGQDLQAIVNSIPANADASICFQAGSFTFNSTIQVTGKGFLKLTGAGEGTHLIANGVEAALAFQGCKGVTLRDLWVESRAQGKIDEHLNGVLTFLSCAEVAVESVALTCSANTDTAAACLAVRPADNKTGGAQLVRVTRSRFAVGSGQIGILLVNVARSYVEDNTLDVIELAGAVKLADLAANPRYRARLVNLLVSNIQTSAKAALKTRAAGVSPTPGATTPGSGATTSSSGEVNNAAVANATNASLKVGAFQVSFLTAGPLRNAWQTLVQQVPPGDIKSNADLQNYLANLATKAIVDENTRKLLPGLREYVDAIPAQVAAAAQQGIVVSGQVAGEIHLLHNTIHGFFQGIHVGLSHRETTPGAPDKAGAVSLLGNRIQLRLTIDAQSEERHGIFLGNFDSLLIQDNLVSVERRAGAEKYSVQGVILWGFFGNRLMVRANHLRDFNPGVWVVPLAPPNTPLPPVRLWLVAENIAEGASKCVQAPASVTQTGNVPA